METVTNQGVDLVELLLSAMPASESELAQVLVDHDVRPTQVKTLIRLARKQGHQVIRQDGAYHSAATVDAAQLLADEHRRLATLATLAAVHAGMYPDQESADCARMYAAKLEKLDRPYRLSREKALTVRRINHEQERLALIDAELAGLSAE